MLFKKIKKLNLILCLVVCFSFVSNFAFAGSDLDRALSLDVKPDNAKDDYVYYQNYYENISENDKSNSSNNNNDNSYKFVNNFVDAVSNNNVSEIKYYLQKGENEIVKCFRAYHNKYEDLKHPKTNAYYFIAKGNFIVGRRETAYKYYSSAISFLNNIQNPDQELKASLLRERAFCVFTMRNSDSFEDYNVKKAFTDLSESLNINDHDWVTYYYAGIMNISLGELEFGLNKLIQAKDICEDSNIKNIIQQEIDEIRDNEPGIIDKTLNFVDEYGELLFVCGKACWKVIKFFSN